MAITNCIIKRQSLQNDEKTRLKAAANLNGMAYKLYTYLETFQNEEEYSRAVFLQLMHTTPKSANAAFEELVEKTYLNPENSLTYFFLPEGKNTKVEDQDGNFV